MHSDFGFLTALATLSSIAAAEQCDVIDTTVGKVEGLINSQTPGIKQWLGVPYAEPPVQSLRFSPPVAKSKGGLIQARKPPPSCQQYLTAKLDIFNQETPEFLPPGPFNEDCLYLNIIAPRLPHRHPLPVLVWIHGGMTTFGGINTPYERPQKWVQRSQRHIVVQVNYRLNIFGFPNAKGLDQTNLGILDQRLALEWVRNNIRNFGGDPSRITLWGQSAGGATADAHQFAFASDPIFSSVLAESGDVLNAMTGSDPNRTSFSLVAQKLGCPVTESPTDEVACMRKIDANVIERFLLNYTDSGATPPLYFSAVADNKIAFLPQQYVAKGTVGDFANVPMLIGSNTNEGSSFVPFSKSGAGVTPALDEAVTLKVIQCGVATTCRYRQASGRTTFRYLYGGNFTNISPLSWLGAYHFSELPLIMGTDSDYRSASTTFETELSHKMQDLWLTFALDPVHGLPKKGWNPYSAGNAIVFGINGTLVGSEPVVQLDGQCPPPS